MHKIKPGFITSNKIEFGALSKDSITEKNSAIAVINLSLCI